MLTYSEGFIKGSDFDDKDKYNEAFNLGKQYSLEFGKVLGRIE